MPSSAHWYSVKIDGKDLRATILNSLCDDIGTSHTLSDPATMTDNIMVALGFDSGCTDDGDYAPGYREYMEREGLISA